MIKNFKLLTVALLLIALSVPFSAKAKVITDESVFELHDMISKELKALKIYGNITGYEINLGGDIEITNNDTFYRAMLPNVSIYIRDLDKNINIGNIVDNIIQ